MTRTIWPTHPGSVDDEVTQPEPDGGNERVKVSMNFLRRDLDTLRAWAAEESTSMTHVVQRALSVYRLLMQAQRDGNEVIIRKPGSRGRELQLAPLSSRLIP